jgi:hypothetical protein
MPSDVLRSERYNPCHGCPDRYLACSDHCKKPAFQDWKAEQEAIRKNRAVYNGMNDYVFRQSERNRRKRK